MAASSWSGTARARARSLHVPQGSNPKAVCEPARGASASLMVPSPPQTTSRSAPSATACCANSVAWPLARV